MCVFMCVWVCIYVFMYVYECVCVYVCVSVCVCNIVTFRVTDLSQISHHVTSLLLDGRLSEDTADREEALTLIRRWSSFLMFPIIFHKFSLNPSRFSLLLLPHICRPLSGFYSYIM